MRSNRIPPSSSLILCCRGLPSSNTDGDFTAYAGVVVYHTGHPKYDLSVVPDLKTVRAPFCCSRRRRSGPRKSFYDSRTAVDLNSASGCLLNVGLWVLISL